jgi:hypothetical protein
MRVSICKWSSCNGNREWSPVLCHEEYVGSDCCLLSWKDGHIVLVRNLKVEGKTVGMSYLAN